MVMTCGNSRSLLDTATESAIRPQNTIHTTIIGFGFDFDTNLSTQMSEIPLCNYFCVNSADEFLHQMTWEFDYFVFPIATELVVSLVEEGEEEIGMKKTKEQNEKTETESDMKETTTEKGKTHKLKNVELEALCGSPSNLEKYGPFTLMASSGLFASQTQGNDRSASKGSIVLAKLRLREGTNSVCVRYNVVDCDGNVHSKTQTITFPNLKDGDENVFGGTAIRKVGCECVVCDEMCVFFFFLFNCVFFKMVFYFLFFMYFCLSFHFSNELSQIFDQIGSAVGEICDFD
jgi:hypothetical protein